MLHNVYTTECVAYYSVGNDHRYFRRVGAIQLTVSGYYNIKGVGMNMLNALIFLV